MRTLRVRGGSGLRGRATVPGDKSLSHRALILGALADGVTRVRGFLPAGDALATLAAVRALGVRVDRVDATTLAVHGAGWRAPAGPLDCANAGTAMRLLAGALAGQPFASTLDGRPQLRRRPMGRVVTPLRLMGADITDTDGRAPLHIRPASLHGIIYALPVASAQVKSALLLAGLFAEGPTTVIEPGPARDHTERLLAAMGAQVGVDGSQIALTPGRPLAPLDMQIPGDFSSAAFLLVAATLTAGADVIVRDVGLNPRRIGLLDVLRGMGAEIAILGQRTQAWEPAGDLRVRPADLRGVAVGGEVVVRMIDEFPVLAVAATQAAGETVVRDAAELRVKETDRIAVLAGELRRLGAEVEERPDGFAIEGPQRLRGAVVDAHDDHRLAMALVVAGLVAEGETVIQGAACVTDSFPGFAEVLATLGAEVGAA